MAHVSGWWLNLMDPPDILEVALAVEPSSYMSFESALHRHGIMSRAPQDGLTMATSRRTRVLDTPLGKIRFVHLAAERFFGHDENRIALPEKAWLDLAYSRGLRDREWEASEGMDLGRLDGKLLGEMSMKFPDWVWEAWWWEGLD